MDASYVLGQINSFSKEIDDQVIGIFLISLPEWNIKSFIPILYLSKSRLYLQLKDRSTVLEIKNIHNTELQNDLLKIHYLDDELSLSLVEIFDNFKKPSRSYTQKFKTLLDKMIIEDIVDLSIIESLPNQKSVGVSSNKGLVILIVGILFIVISFLLQSIFPTVSWFFLFSGLISAIIGLIFKIFGKN